MEHKLYFLILKIPANCFSFSVDLTRTIKMRTQVMVGILTLMVCILFSTQQIGSEPSSYINYKLYHVCVYTEL